MRLKNKILKRCLFKDKTTSGPAFKITDLDLLERKLEYLIYEERFISDEYKDSSRAKKILLLLDMIRADLRKLEKDFNLEDDGSVYKEFGIDAGNQVIDITYNIRDFFKRYYILKVSFEDDGKVIIEKGDVENE